jgi:hypothetical protein
MGFREPPIGSVIGRFLIKVLLALGVNERSCEPRNDIPARVPTPTQQSPRDAAFVHKNAVRILSQARILDGRTNHCPCDISEGIGPPDPMLHAELRRGVISHDCSGTGISSQHAPAKSQ